MKFPAFMMATVTLSLSLSLLACAKKPKQEARQEPPAPILEPAAVAVPTPAQKAAAVRIEDLLAEAFKPVYFPYDQAMLPESAKDLLATAGALLKQYPTVTVRIDGHADERGTDDYNLALGEKRANSVKAYLVNYGVEGSRLNIISYGEEKPEALGHEESDWAKNRRGEFKVTVGPEAE